ncbi:MAG: serine esterase [Bdellovibrionaceae bacterium]|nr:serine esterase [Pseudobdellovibrionaceae bacterium]
MRKIGPVQALDHVRDPDAPWFILFHGYGADAFDLQPLGDLILLSKDCNFLFPQGGLEVPIGPGWTGRAWWPINMARLQNAQAGGGEWDTSEERPEILPQVREKAFKMIEAMKVPWNRIILGGFSQGGMLAADLAVHAPENPLGLVLMSSALINKPEMKEKAPARKGLPFFQSHGEMDPVLTLKNGQRLETLLTQAGLKGSIFKFKGGHEIPQMVLERLGAYIDERVGSLS